MILKQSEAQKDSSGNSLCFGCSGFVSNEKCQEISKKAISFNLRPCSKGYIYMEVK